ncbi:MAG: carboxypeptidase-like regulatory domain-containing protein, partial [Polyangiaceae bacterium]
MSFAHRTLMVLGALSLFGCGGGSSSGSGGGATTTMTTSSTSSSTSMGGGGAGGSGGDTTTTPTGGAGGTTTMPQSYEVTFTYKPRWSGVTGVDVVGGFGKPTDWKSATPLLKLTDDGTGTWTGKTTLLEGSYLYLFRVKGDSEGPDSFVRYALDTAQSVKEPCPPESPTYSDTSKNPCSTLKVPQPAAADRSHITGKVLYGGAPAAGYLVVIDSDESQLGPYFTNRMTTGPDGSYDLDAPVGVYRIQVQHPTYLTMTDADRDPLTLKAFRRAISSSFYLPMDTALYDIDMDYEDYDKLSPVMTSTLPTTFEVTLLPGADAVRVAVYGFTGGTGTNVGNQWWLSDYGTATSVPWDGTFNAMSASEANVVPGEQYY